MYKEYLEYKKINNRMGIVTTTHIRAGVPIMEFTGDLFTKEQAKSNFSEMIQIFQDMYLGPSGDVDDLVNHSCDPNCFVHIVGKRAVLYSLHSIPEGIELTYDYSAPSTDMHDDWKMECNCGSFKCRKVISGLQYLSPETQLEYKNKGIIPLWIISPIFKKS